MQAAPWQGHTGHLNVGPSKWWAWGLAIFMGIWVFMSLIGVIISAIIPYDLLLDGWDPEEPGEYPADGTSEEQDEWNTTKEEWDSHVALSGLMEDLEDMKPIQITTGMVGCIIGFVAVVMLIQQNPTGFKAAYLWLGLSTIGQLWMHFKVQATMTEFYSNIYVEESDSFVLAFQSGMQIGGMLFCNTMLLLIIIMCSMKSQDRGLVEESGFHRQPIQSNEPLGPQT